MLAPLARGGTAGVYLAESIATKELVALKVLDPYYCENADVTARMFAEREVSMRVRHPGLLEVRVADRSVSGIPYLVMEYLEGENLGALADRGRIALDAVIAIGAQIARAVAAMHAVGIAHCDLKPDNILVLYASGPRGWPRVKVIDFGVAHFVEHDDTESSDTTIAGTPAYMSPEQWEGVATEKSDVYALGCLLYELITGDPPFQGTLPQLMMGHCERLPQRPSAQRADLPAELDRLITRALAKDPALRPTMSELENVLQRILDAESETALGATG